MADNVTGKSSLAGRVALVTGSGRNIGRGIALEFGRRGATVLVNGHRNKEALESVVAEIEAAGGKAEAVVADVSDPSAIAAMVKAAHDKHGSLDIVVSNVAIRKHAPFLEITPEEWLHTFDTNLHPTYYLARYTIPRMMERKWGRLINISGIDGFTGHITDRVLNVTCKIGLVGMTKALAREFGEHGITANVVAPGAIDTERDWSQYPNYHPEEVVKRIAVKRLGLSEDIGMACGYLGSDEGGFVSGQTLHLNGGEFMF